jgi:cytochrome c peroxidase
MALRQSPRPLFFSLIGILVIAAVAASYLLWLRFPWKPSEVTMLDSLWIGRLPPLAPDPSNRFGDDPSAAAFGQKLFFDTRFSLNGAVACGTCHLSGKLFQDGLPLARGIGTTNRRTMTVIGTAYSPWLFWDGRKDSLWAQALGPLENPVEHGGDRTMYAHLVAQHYRQEYEAIFGPLLELSHLPEQAGPIPGTEAANAWEAMSPADQEAVTLVYTNIGKAIAAYERLLNPGPARFDQYVEAVLNRDTRSMKRLFSADETAGLKLFIGKAECTQCHNGPLLTDNHFHNTGVPVAVDLPEDTGRALGALQVLKDEFNCLSKYSDAEPEDCSELRFMISEGEELVRQFKPPSLRNIAERGPFMHAGQFKSLEGVLEHYSTAPEAPAGHSELKPLNLTEKEKAQIIAFLKTLSGPVDANPQWLGPPAPTSSQ